MSGREFIDLRTPWRWVLLVACAFGLALVFAPPFAASHSDVVRLLFDPVCHQIPARSFHVLGEPLTVCHRCTGLYVGFAVGVLAWPWLPTLATRLAANPRWVAVFLIPLAIDWAIVVNTPATRFATGLIAAFPVALLSLVAFTQRTNQIPLANNKE